METERPFKLFVPPRLSNGPVSAVRPQEVVEDNCFMQAFHQCVEDDYGLPFLMTSALKTVKNKKTDFADPIPQKMKHVPEIEKENTEEVGQLYSKLYHEADKIKRWKMTMDAELRQKEKKLQENKRTIEAQRKAIQELQFENEKLSMKLEEEIKENKDLTNESNATRHLCNLLKETCSRSAEKMKKYEHEREETRQLCAQNNENIERMILAFEELCMKAENARLEMLKEEAENREWLKKEHQTELSEMEKEILQLKKQYEEKDSELKKEMCHYQESKNKCGELEKMLSQHTEKLKESYDKQQKLVLELEETKVSLQKAKIVQQSTETELQVALKMLAQVTEEKETNAEDLKAAEISHASVVTDLQATIGSLEASLIAEQQRVKEFQESTQNMLLELEKKTTEMGEMMELKKDREKQLEELREALLSATKFGKDMEEQLMNEKIENGKLKDELETTNAVHFNLKENMQVVLAGKQHLEKMVEVLQQKLRDMEDAVKTKEKNMQVVMDRKQDFEETVEMLNQKLRDVEDTVQSKEEHVQAVLAGKQNLEKMVEMLQQKLRDMEDTVQSKEEHIQAALAGKQNLEKMVEMLQQKLRDMEDTVQTKENLEHMVETLQKKLRDLEDTVQIKEDQIQDIRGQLFAVVGKQESSSESVKELKAELQEEKKKNEELSANCKKLELEKDQDIITADSKIKYLEIHLKASKENEEKSQMEVKKLKEDNSQQREELQSLKESVQQKGEEAEIKLVEHMQKARTMQSDISKQEKQIKALENKCNTLKKQAESKSKYIEELQQESKSLKKKIAAGNKQCSHLEAEINDLKVELENLKSHYEENIKDLQKKIDDKIRTEEQLTEELGRMKIVADEAVKMQKETDTRCQHKITEMVALMEKHKHQYDKALEEKDTELGLCKTKELEAISANKALELELSSCKSELSSFKQQLEKITEEKENLAKDAEKLKETIQTLKEEKKTGLETINRSSSKHEPQSATYKKEVLPSSRSSVEHIRKPEITETPSRAFARSVASTPSLKMDLKTINPSSSNHGPQSAAYMKEVLPSSHSSAERIRKSQKTETPSRAFARSVASTPSLKTYTVKTPPKNEKVIQRGKTTLSTDEVKKKRKVALEFDVHSDSSEHSDLLSMLSETEMFSKLYKGDPQAARLCEMTPKKVQSPSTLKSPGTALKLATLRKMREAGWAAITNSDRKKKMKVTEKIFA